MDLNKTIQPEPTKGISSPVRQPIYLGGWLNVVDKSKRFLMPPPWRQAGFPTEFIVMAVPSVGFLSVTSPELFGIFLAELRAETKDKKLLPLIERKLNDQVRPTSLDAYGRLPLPSDLLDRVGISSQVQLIARFNKFEVWAPDRYQASQNRQEAIEAQLQLDNKMAEL